MDVKGTKGPSNNVKPVLCDGARLKASDKETERDSIKEMKMRGQSLNDEWGHRELCRDQRDVQNNNTI